MIRIPAGYVGGTLCWRGTVMWKAKTSASRARPAEGCRAIEAADAGQRVFGIAIVPDTLAMRIDPPWTVWARQLLVGALAFAGLAGLVKTLVRVQRSWTILPLAAVGLSALVIAIDDASFLGGVRPFDGGDDGLFYDGVGRAILQQLVNGDFAGFLHGGESVFTMVVRVCDISVRSAHFLRRKLSAISRSSCCSPFSFTSFFAASCPATGRLRLSFVFIVIPVGALFRHKLCALRADSQRAASPTPAASSCSLPECLQSSASRRAPESSFGLFWRAVAHAGDLDRGLSLRGRRGFARRRWCRRTLLWQWPRLIGLSIGGRCRSFS